MARVAQQLVGGSLFPPMDVHGSCDARFEPVRQAFARNFEELGEVGAAVTRALYSALGEG